ncbi:MAG: efflux RND transporter periplasmic adaptor subunit [Nannocystaceae bacterium]|nr:efflux RND transporter periplasmic adaptor subunit [Nannocystaceae bacterium]
MSRAAGLFVCLLVLLTQTVCRTREPEAQEHAPAPAEPVASEPFCAEHGVPEAACTRCNPELVAVYQAKGDWCDEHGFPESVCPICRGTAPAAESPDDGAPADGLEVRLASPAIAARAGLRTEALVARPGRTELIVTARIAYDATKLAEVNPRAPGVVREVAAEIGTKVRAGSKLATIESAGVGADQSRLQSARARLQVADANAARLETLRRSGLASEQAVVDAQGELAAAKAEVAASRAALRMVGGIGESGSRYALFAPIAGVVAKRDATIGRLVDTDKVLFQIVDTSTVWAELDVSELDVSRVAIGQTVTVAVDGMGDRSFSGTITSIAPEIDPHTRTATARAPLDNPQGLLRANMFANATIAVVDAGVTLMAPRTAVQRVADVSMVFVRRADDLYEVRRVELGAQDGEQVEVRGRLAAGDLVVTDGSFLLKTETLAGSIGAGCCAVDEEH